MDTIELDLIHLKAIDKLKTKGHRFTIKKTTEEVIRIDAYKDEQRNGEYLNASLFIIDGKIYERVKEDWQKKNI